MPRKPKTGVNAPLKAVINKDGQLSITIGVSTLAFALQRSEKWEDSAGDWAIIDERRFAKDLLVQLEDEDETGANAIHRMLDEAAMLAIEGGSLGVEDNSESEAGDE